MLYNDMITPEDELFIKLKYRISILQPTVPHFFYVTIPYDNDLIEYLAGQGVGERLFRSSYRGLGDLINIVVNKENKEAGLTQIYETLLRYDLNRR